MSALPLDSGGRDRPVCALHETAEEEGGEVDRSVLSEVSSLQGVLIIDRAIGAYFR